MSELFELFHELIVWWMDQPVWVCYLVVVVLMAMESSIFPVPSEVVIPPAAIMATQGTMSLTGVIIAGVVGSWIGSAITYEVSRVVGRPLVMKYGKYFFMPPHKVERAENFLRRYQTGGIFFARLLPVVRHLISIPAGMVKMRFGMFSLMTISGAAIWCSILTWYGHKVGVDNPGMLDTPKELVDAIKNESAGIIILVAVLCGLYFLMTKLSSGKKGKEEAKQAVTEEEK